MAPTAMTAMGTPVAVASSDPWSQALLSSLAPAAGPLEAVQRRGRAGLTHQAMPSRRAEAWRFTDTAVIQAIAPQLLQPAPEALPACGEGVWRLRLDGGEEALADQAWPAGLTPLLGPDLELALGQTLADTGGREHWPVLLNKATAPRVLALRVRGEVAPTLELVSEAGAGPGVLPVRVLLLLEEQARLTVLQVHRSGGANLTSVVVEARLGRGAHLSHGVLAQGHPEAALLAHLAVVQHPDSNFDQVSTAAGWGLVRIEPRVLQSEGSAATSLLGLQAVRGQQLADTHSQVRFGGPDGTLEQGHRAIADGAGRSVFNGAVQVPQAAQRTNASQLSRNLLLSDRARIDTKPELEIVADDVRCAHGATVSRLQQDELFYLQSRGIGVDQAARLLLRGFCAEVLAALPAAAAPWQPLEHLLDQEETGDPEGTGDQEETGR